jgi:hypothetical protein
MAQFDGGAEVQRGGDIQSGAMCVDVTKGDGQGDAVDDELAHATATPGAGHRRDLIEITPVPHSRIR